MANVDAPSLFAAIMEGTIRGGATRHVAAAVASAILRTGLGTNSSLQGYEEVPVPSCVAPDIPVVAASLASQRRAEDIADNQFHNAGQAYAELRSVLPKELANDWRAINRARNEVFHGTRRAGKRRVSKQAQESKDNEIMTDPDLMDENNLIGEWVYGAFGSRYTISKDDGQLFFRQGDLYASLNFHRGIWQGEVLQADGSRKGDIQLSLSWTIDRVLIALSRYRCGDGEWDRPTASISHVGEGPMDSANGGAS